MEPVALGALNDKDEMMLPSVSISNRALRRFDTDTAGVQIALQRVNGSFKVVTSNLCRKIGSLRVRGYHPSVAYPLLGLWTGTCDLRQAQQHQSCSKTKCSD